MQKMVSQLDAAGYFVGAVVADESPLEPGVFILPGGAVDLEPPDSQPGKAYTPKADRTGWRGVEDYRSVALYLTSDGSAYILGQERGTGGAYAGLGPIPEWLTTDLRPDAWSVWKSGKWVRDDIAWRSHLTAGNEARRAQLSAIASERIATLQDAVDLDIATPAEVSVLKQWRVYRIELLRVDATQDAPTWPASPAEK